MTPRALYIGGWKCRGMMVYIHTLYRYMYRLFWNAYIEKSKRDMAYCDHTFWRAPSKLWLGLGQKIRKIEKSEKIGKKSKNRKKLKSAQNCPKRIENHFKIFFEKIFLKKSFFSTGLGHRKIFEIEKKYFCSNRLRIVQNL